MPITFSTNVFTREFAASYEEVRPLDAGCFRKAVSAFIESRKPEELQIVDVGCGTGRVLKPLVSCGFAVDNILGIDSSAAMLSEAVSHEVLQGVRFVHDDVRVFGSRPANAGKFDVVLAHWILHCVDEWRSILLNCATLANDSGCIAWFEEDGDIYRCLDLLEPLSTSEDAKIIHSLFEVYYREIAGFQESFGSPAKRAGTPVRNSEMVSSHLETIGWQAIVSADSHEWFETRSLDWLLDRVLGARSFTNLQRINPSSKARGLEAVRSAMARLGIAPNFRVKLAFSLRACHAKRKAAASKF